MRPLPERWTVRSRAFHIRGESMTVDVALPRFENVTLRVTATDGTIGSAQASIGSYGYNGTSSQELVALGLRHKF